MLVVIVVQEVLGGLHPEGNQRARNVIVVQEVEIGYIAPSNSFDKIPPGPPLRIVLGVFAGRFFDVAGSAKCFRVLRIVGRAAILQAVGMVAFEPTGPAAFRAPAIRLSRKWLYGMPPSGAR